MSFRLSRALGVFRILLQLVNFVLKILQLSITIVLLLFEMVDKLEDRTIRTRHLS